MNQNSPVPIVDDTEHEPLNIHDANAKKHHEGLTDTKKNPQDTKLRWIVLMLSIGTNYGGFFCNDNPQALQVAIQQAFGIEDAEFNLLYSMTILPNVILPFIGGMATDYFGVGFTMLIVGALVLIGQSIVALGAFLGSFVLMVIGRFIFGSGFQTMENTLLIIISKWFLDKELSFSYGLTRTILRTATSLNSVMTPLIYSWTGSILAPIMLGVVLVILSLICTLIVVGIDKKADKEYKIKNEAELGPQQISFKEIKHLPKLYFLMMIIGLLVYASFYGFTNNVNSFLVHRFGFTSQRAGLLIMIIYIVAAVLSPFIGLWIDRVGKRTIFILVAGIVFLSSHGLLLVLEDRPPEDPNYAVIFGFIGLGVFYSVFSPAYWTSLPMIVAPQAVGVGVGLVMSSLAITQAVYTEVIGLIHDNTIQFHSGYYWTQACHCIVVCLFIGMAVWAYFEDIRGKAILYKPRQKGEAKYE